MISGADTAGSAFGLGVSAGLLKALNLTTSLQARTKVYHHVAKRGITNVEIIEDDFSRCRFPDADVLYYITKLNVHQFQKWNRRRKKRNL